MAAVRAVDGIRRAQRRRSSRPRRPPARCSSARARARGPRRRVRARVSSNARMRCSCAEHRRQQRRVGGLPVGRGRGQLDPGDPGLERASSAASFVSVDVHAVTVRRRSDTADCIQSQAHCAQRMLDDCQMRRDGYNRSVTQSRRSRSDAWHCPGLRGTDHIGFTVPDLDEADASSSTSSAPCPSTRSGRNAPTTTG